MSGALSKLVIAALDNPRNKFQLLFNPESLKLSRKVSYTKDQTLGTSANVNRFTSHAPSSLSFSFVLDGTGVVYNKVEKVMDTVKRFEYVVYQYIGGKHEPNALKISWGDQTFDGRLESLDYEYTLFAPNGEPLRAKVSVSFVNYITRKKEKAKGNASSPDLSHIVTLKAGESIPFWCNEIYGDASYCMDIARYNGLDNFRNIKPGTRLLFPPLVRNG